ncbi:MAG: MBL fold metallo-hydrolase [Candidatus Microsaccharimonas sp.]
MNITKLVHSCLIVESNGKRIVTDPGNYSWQSGVVMPELLIGIDTVVVTHAHPDHLYEEFAKAIKQASPDAKWYGPTEVVEQLSNWDIQGSTASDTEDVRFIESQHADLAPWFKVQPEHTSFVVFEELLIGGDCHTLTESHGARVFAAAVNGGPWGAIVGFTRMIESMTDRPEVVIPLHDWHFNDDARQGIYTRLPQVLSEFDVQFVPLENGVAKQI